MNSESSKYVCYFVAGLLFFLILGAILTTVSRSADESDTVVARVVNCPMREALSYTSSAPRPEVQQNLTRRAQVAQKLRERMGPTYQSETMNAMRTTPVRKEQFTNSFVYPQEPQTILDMKLSPFIGEINP
jgi:hypothetical protein